MAFWLTLAYVVLTYFAPDDLLPAIAPYRPNLVIAGLAILASAFSIGHSALFRVRQTYLLLGLIAAVFLSQLVHLWFGGIVLAAQQFLPNAIVFLLECVNVNTWRRLRIAVATLVICALSLLALSAWSYLQYEGGEDLF